MIREASWLGTMSERVLWSVEAVQVRRFVKSRMRRRLLGNRAISATAQTDRDSRLFKDAAVIAEPTGHRDLLARGQRTVLCRTR